MSRIKKFTVSLLTGQVAVGITIIYTAVSIPLALYYLDLTEFGVWAVVVQWVGYLALIDSGMSLSFGRMLIDHKDTRESGKYGAMFKLILMINMVQGVAILLLGVCLSAAATFFLKLPLELQQKFHYLLIGQSALIMATFFLRAWNGVLFSHQRMDVNNYQNSIQLLLSLALLFIFFKLGAGIYAILYANAVSFVLCAWIPIWVCHRSGYLPKRNEYGKINWELAREPIRYGINLFFINLGTQLTVASQTLLVGRLMGLEAAAIWALMTKPFNMACQIVWKIFNFAAPALVEMMVRKEQLKIQQAFKEILKLTGYAAALTAAGLAVCNNDFMTVWTGGRVSWLWWDSWLLGGWFFLLSLSRCWCILPILTKDVAWEVKYIYLLEGALFIGLMLNWRGEMNFTLMLVLSIVTGILFSGTYGVVRAAELLKVHKREMLKWSGGSLVALILLTTVGGSAYLILHEQAEWLRLVVCATLITGLGGILIWFYGLNVERQRLVLAYLLRLTQFAARQ